MLMSLNDGLALKAQDLDVKIADLTQQRQALREQQADLDAQLDSLGKQRNALATLVAEMQKTDGVKA